MTLSKCWWILTSTEASSPWILLIVGCWQEVWNVFGRKNKFLSLTVGCRRKMSDDFSLTCLKIALTHFTTGPKKLRARDTGQAVSGCKFTSHIKTTGGKKTTVTSAWVLILLLEKLRTYYKLLLLDRWLVSTEIPLYYQSRTEVPSTSH